MYKRNYLIGIYTYDKYELCEAILESPEEFMQYANLTINVARAILSKVFHNQTEFVIIDGRRKKIEFINTKDF